MNVELQKIIEKLQKKTEEKQGTLESMTQGKENLNVILGAKINFNKEGLGFIPTIKKKYDVKTMTFVSQQSATKTNPLIKMNCPIVEKPKLIPTIEANLKEKGKKKWEKTKWIILSLTKIQKSSS